MLALVLGWWWMSGTAPVVASVELLAGTVRTTDAVELAVGGELTAGATVETAGWVEGAPAGLALRLAGGQSLRLAADTTVRLVSDRRFELERGTLYVDSDANAVAGGVEVVTVLGTVHDIGTQFEVRLSEGDAAVRVRVREGEVALEADGDSHRAVRGDQLSLLGDGSVVRAGIEPYGPEWAWVLATAPGIDIDGRSLDPVLRWVARAAGRGMRYAEAGLARAAATEMILSGSAAGLPPAETLDVAVTSSTLRHRVENGTILISR